MTVRPYTAPQAAEKQVFQQPAKTRGGQWLQRLAQKLPFRVRPYLSVDVQDFCIYVKTANFQRFQDFFATM